MGAKKYTVMHVSTNDHYTAEVKSLLEQEGFKVRKANSIDEALQTSSGIPNVVIIDADIAELKESTKGIKTVRERHHIPIVIISSDRTTIHNSKLLKYADLFFHRPLDPSVLVVNIQLFLRSWDAQKKLLQKEERFRRLVENAEDVLYRYEIVPVKRFAYINPAIRTLTGYEPEELYNNPQVGAQMVYPEDLEKVVKYFQGEGGLKNPLTVRFVHKSGRIVWVEQKAVPIYDEKKRLIGFEGSIRDITEHKEADEKIRESEETYRNLFQNAQVGLFRTRIADGKILESNEQLARMFGYESRDEFIANFATVENYVDPGTREKMLEEIQRQGYIKHFEARFYKKDRSIFWARFSARLYPEKGWIEGVAEDITKQKEAEETIRSSEKRYRELIEHAPFGILLTDKKGIIVYENPAMRSIIGVPNGTESKAIGVDLSKLPSVVAAGVSEKVLEVLRGNKVSTFELPFTSIYGKQSYLTAEGIPIKDLEGNVTGGLYVMQDVSERKKAEEALLKYTRNLERIHRIGLKLQCLCTTKELAQNITEVLDEIAENDYISILLIDGNSNRLVPFALSSSWYREGNEKVRIPDILNCTLHVGQGITGWVAQTGESLCCSDVSSDPRYYQVLEDVRSELCVPIKAGDTILGVLDLESVKLHAYDSSDVRVAETIGLQIGIALQNAKLYEKVQEELNERIKIEKELRKNEEHLSQIVNTVPSGITIVDQDGHITFANPTAERILGISRSELNTRMYNSPEWKITTIDGKPFPAEELPFAIVKRTTQPVYNVEHAIEKPDGNRVFLSINAVPLLGENNEFSGMIAALTDITRLKQTEQSLRELTNRQNALLEAIPDIVVEVDTNKVYTWSNKAGYEFFGDDMIGKPAEYYFEGVQDTYRKVQPLFNGSDEIIYLESWQRRKDGAKRLLAWWCRTLKDEHGHVIGALSSARDITEQKLAEEQLRESIEKYRALFNQSVEGIYLHDLDGNILEVNQMACQQSGYTKEELLSSNVFDFIAQGTDTLNLPREKIIRLWYEWKPGETYTFVAEHIHKSGKKYPVEVTSGVVKFNDRNLILAIVKDITERHNAEVAIKASEEKYRLLAETTPDLIILHDMDGKIVYVNKAAIQFSGKEAHELIGTSIIDYIPVENHKALRDRLERRRAGDTSIYHYESTIQQGYKQCVFDIYSAPVIIQGKVEQILLVARDITERKRMEEELRTQEENIRQIQKLEAIGQLASGIAHDFNNILGIIMGYASQLSLCAELPEKCKRHVNIIEKTTQRGADLVKQLLTVARKTESVVQNVNLEEVITELVRMLKETFPKNIEIEFARKGSLPFILGDASQIHQILMNLCVNARDAMPTGGTLRIGVEVCLGTELRKKFPDATAEKYVSIMVSDTGCGIPEDVLPRIFDPFFTTKEVGKGSGLGLSIVHSIVRNHNGFVDLTSKVGAGSTFIIYLPIPDVDAVTDHKEFEESIDMIKGGTETVLVIEDEEPLLEMLSTYLEMKGYHVLRAKDGEEGVEIYKAQRETIALVITDYGLPRLMGDEVVERIRQIEPRANIIIASGFIEPEVKNQLLQGGVLDFIQKPYQPLIFLRKVREVLDRTT